MAVLSSIPVVKNALYDRLAARTALAAPVLVSYGPPAANPGNEIVWVADQPEPSTREQVGGGPAPHWYWEDYVLEVFCRVRRPGGQQQECTERAFVLAAEVEDEIADDPRINAAISAGGLAEVVGTQLAELADDQKREAVVSVRVHCHTLIGP